MLKRLFVFLVILLCLGRFFSPSADNISTNTQTKGAMQSASMEEVQVDPAYSPRPYKLCTTQWLKQSHGGLIIRPIITTVERDMAILTNHELAGTVSSALRYFEEQYRADSPAIINVLLMPSCINTQNAIARAQIQNGKREAFEPNQERGPSKDMLLVGDAIERQKHGIARATSDADYLAAGKALNISAEKAKSLHFSLAEYFPVNLAFPCMNSHPAMAPEPTK